MDDERENSIEMDAITAHLERGWDLLHRGDLTAARVSAHHILKLSSDSPEAHTLLGAIAAAEGDAEEALELFRQAMALDPDYLDAMLFAAEIAISPLGDFETALELCAEAEELVLEPDEELDVSLLRAEALCAAGRLDEAGSLVAARLPGPEGYPEADHLLRAGRVLLDLGKPDAAREHFERALATGGRGPDLHYFLGIALEQTGEERRAMEQFLEVVLLEQEAPATDEERGPAAAELQSRVEEAISTLTEAAAALLRGRPIRVLDLPAMELVAEGVDPWATLYLSGALALAPGEGAEPSPRRTKGKAKGKAKSKPSGEGRPSPATVPVEPEAPGASVHCIFVYRRNLLRVARTPREIAEELKAALEHEVLALSGLPAGSGAALTAAPPSGVNPLGPPG